jgi:curved DNA-binding protein CbpA
VTADEATTKKQHQKMPGHSPLASTYYGLLGLYPSASSIEIRRAYRELSKRYHPDTTDLPTAIATTKFQQLNEAYATLSNPELRVAYDRKLAYSRLKVIQTLSNLNHPASNSPTNSDSAYLDPTERPLSPGEIFILLILGITLLGCLGIAIVMSL